MGGTPHRMKSFAEFMLKELGTRLETGTCLEDISARSHRSLQLDAPHYPIILAPSTIMTYMRRLFKDFGHPVCKEIPDYVKQFNFYAKYVDKSLI